ncbi:phospho-N-acetylmuramoyl-pentapeptide-transferase [Mailhella massiliensis]|uniref:phospho-N-acetylmuramoyl-pentapeptide- transferase n=1 Tax=Mailhella massiliensis TaxID=1903261 RepID=UPI002357DA72|nr:phospho-N-acetylmuramoyl-pentapeptide-transferase [Mailhella massiliensis]
MLYNLLVPFSQDISLLNVFRYITFRSAGALICALLFTILAGPWFLKKLTALKVGQPILSYVPEHQAKAGTPTMGGLLIMAGAIVSTLLWADLANVYIWLTMLVFVGFGAVGFVDDYTKIRHHENKGLSPRAKMLGLIVVSAVAISLLLMEPAYSSKLSVPFFKEFMPDLGMFYVVFAVVVLIASSNAVNLTDGLDGLAILPAVMCFMVYAIFIYVAGHASFAQYLQVPAVPGVGEVTVFCCALMGAGLGFLWFNCFPAQVFMGDVGSLSLGGVLGFLAVLCKQELILIVAGGVFVMETVSVIMQVGFFKATHGRRLFRMTPLHHHFQKGEHPLPESKIIVRFWIISVLLAIISLSVLKLR